MKTNTNPAQYSHSYSLSFYTSFSSFFPDPLLALFVFVSLFFFLLFKSMTLSFSLKYQHLSIQHMAADAAHARHHGAAPCLDTLQVLRHLASRPPPPHTSSRWRLSPPTSHPPPPRTTALRSSKFTLARSAVKCSTLLRLMPPLLLLFLSLMLELRHRLRLSRLFLPPLLVRITLLPSLNLNLSLGFSFSGMLG